ncbi:gibberellin 20 oxidase 2 [Ricinus communis]|uniref:gibberellin 20 oxidase 2 n=1 Tax=Ricinus communis TaxID=3988 RepID=UPI00201B24A5|nr:gibberellin 20 oxidase 2 [Ricinus communis]
MELPASSLPPSPPMTTKVKPATRAFHFDPSFLKKQDDMPTQFIWAEGDLISATDELNEPLVDLNGFLKGDEEETARAAKLVRSACLKYGFFQVSNHGVDADLIRAAYQEIDTIFKLPFDKKLSIGKKPGSVYGYAFAHSDRFSSKLPWKETLSCGYHAEDTKPVVADYFKHVLGEDFERTGVIYQRYCEEMMKLSLVIFELLAISLGVDRFHYRKYFEDGGTSIMRCNYYPSCNNPSLTLGTGPHCDPTSLTILHQDDVGGLDVFADHKWRSVRPRPNALVINIGDTFMALTNGKYKSCLHRAVVNKESERRSIAFFVNPKEDKVVKPPEDDVACRELGERKYPDFTWSDLLKFTQNHYRSDDGTLQAFTHWFLSSKPSN